MLVEYSSNNSGGNWWLKDKDWLALEKAGWRVYWERRFLGARATRASKTFKSIDTAKDEFSLITGEDTEAEGCSCCGSPHSFYGVREIERPGKKSPNTSRGKKE